MEMGIVGNAVYYIMSNEYYAVSSYALRGLGMVGISNAVMVISWDITVIFINHRIKNIRK